MSSHRKFSVKRKNTLRQDLNPYLTMLLILLTIFTMILTNGLGNIIVIIGIALNLPNYQETQYRMYLAFGITISLLLQPTQFIYVIFLYAAKHITTFDQHFNPSNWWLFIELGRIVILLSKVSLLNFLIGLFQSQYLVMFTLIFRNACSFFKLILVFMGTEDNY